MEEKNSINKNLDELVNCTICNDSLLTNLQAANVLSPEDVQVVKAKNTDFDKAHKFYQIIVTKANFIGKLKDALKITKNSQALQILNTSINEFNENNLIGQGSYGRVYKSVHLGMDVAIKRLQIDAAKFAEREINILKKYSKHDNIVRFLGSGMTDKYLLLYMELCDMNLKYWVSKKHPIKIEPLEVLRQITVGLEWLHGHKVVHMDLKPENILFTTLPERVKISDFGFSRQISDGRSCVSTTEAGGTFGWSAPEIYDEASEEAEGNYKYIYKTSSDIFSLGCIYYFVLTDGKHAFGQGPTGMLHANIIHNKCFIDKDKLLHGCKQNALFIFLMVSRTVNARPTCTTLLSSPLFWSQDRSCKFIYDLLTYEKKILCSVLHSSERTKCNLEHKEEIDMLITVNKNETKADGCVILMAYLKCKKTDGVLGRYYNGENTFDLNELKLSEVVNSVFSDFVAARETEEETLFQLASNTHKELQQFIMESFEYTIKKPSHSVVINNFHAMYHRILDAVVYKLVNVTEAQKLQICKVLAEKCESSCVVLAKTNDIVTSFHSRVNELMRVNVCFPKDKITNELSQLLDQQNRNYIKYVERVYNKLVKTYISQNNCIIEFEERLCMYYCAEVIRAFERYMDMISDSPYGSYIFDKVYSALEKWCMASLKQLWEHQPLTNGVSFIYYARKSELEIRMKKSSIMCKKRFTTAKLESIYIQVNAIILKCKYKYGNEMKTFIIKNKATISEEGYYEEHLISIEKLKKYCIHLIHENNREKEPIDGHLETLMDTIGITWLTYQDIITRMYCNPTNASLRPQSEKKTLPPIIFQISLSRIKIYYSYYYLDLKNFGEYSATVVETECGLLVCEYQLTNDANKPNIKRSWNLNSCLFPEEGTSDDVLRQGETTYKIRTELILGLLFYTLKQEVETTLNGIATECVVIIPFWFTSAQRQQVKDSGRVAGFQETHLVNENSAIALSYLFERSEDEWENDIVILSENSGRVDTTIYSYLGFDKRIIITGHCGDYEINHKYPPSSTSTAKKIRETYNMAAKPNKGIISLAYSRVSVPTRPKTVAVSFHSKECENILLSVGNEISTTKKVWCVSKDIIAQGASIFSRNPIAARATIQDRHSVSIFTKTNLSEEVPLRQNNNCNLYMDLETLRMSGGCTLLGETMDYFQKDVKGRISLIGSLKSDFKTRNGWIDVSLEISSESIVSLKVTEKFAKNLILNHGRLDDSQIVKYTALPNFCRRKYVIRRGELLLRRAQGASFKSTLFKDNTISQIEKTLNLLSDSHITEAELSKQFEYIKFYERRLLLSCHKFPITTV